jgi:SAM-dependent methyltransferase
MLASLRRKLEKSVRNRGVMGTLAASVRYAAFQIAERLPYRSRGRRGEQEFDKSLGVDTAGIIPLSALEVDDPAWLDGHRYQVTPADTFEAMMRAIPRPEGLTFIDLGCGKGRSMLLAARYPFRAVVGVELAPELHRICEENLRRSRDESRRCHDLRAYCADASTYELPPVPSAVFLSNPFGPPIMERMLATLRSSLQRDPRELYFLYYTPESAAMVDRTGFLERIATDEEFAVWRSLSS